MNYAEVLRDYNDGFMDRGIAKKCGMTISDVRQWRKERFLPPNCELDPDYPAGDEDKPRRKRRYRNRQRWTGK